MDADATINEATFVKGNVIAGKYVVEGVIGEGGMGVVLAAEHQTLRQKVAIKLLRAVALGHTDVVGRFMREARAAVRLKSEHVARVLDVGALEDGRPFIVMERLEGHDLGDVIEKGPPLGVQQAVDYVMQACEAIAEAHVAGIVHRDLKPKNLFLTRTVDGRPLVKVLDFGISKVDPAMEPGEMQLTRTAEVIGSPSYMSPEQLRSSRNVDIRTDIWALGVILYELLTKRLPFNADTVTALVLVVVGERERPIQELRPDVPYPLAMIIARCLEKDPALRFASVVDLVQALQPFTNANTMNAADRIRAFAGPAPPTVGAPGPPPPAAASSSRVNIHGGTSVAWGETQSQVGTAPVIPTSKAPLLIAGIVAASMLIAGIVGGTYWVKRSHTLAATTTPPAASMPLPPGRKDLPPLPTPTTPPVVASADPIPIPSALPDVRKPPVPPAKPGTAPPAPPPKPPTAPKGDDLSNIGRR